jgi:Predicted integral membrane protein
MISSYLMLAGYFIFPVLIILIFNRYKWSQKVGTVILAYAVGIIIALLNTALGFLPAEGTEAYSALDSIQRNLMSVCVPIAIPLMLFNSDFKLWTKSLPKTLAVLLGGILSVSVALVAGYFIFRNHDFASPDEFKNVAVMMTGIYTGGTLNFAALGEMIHADPNTISITLAFEEIVTLPFIVFILAGGYKLFRKWLPFKDETSVEEDASHEVLKESTFENYHGMLQPKTFGKMMLGLLLSILMLGIGVGLSMLILGKINELIVILTITTLAIIASFSKKIRELPKTFELGMFFILVFSVVVASKFDVTKIDSSSLTIMWYILFVMVTSIVLHLLFCRASKVSADLFTVGHISLLCSPPFVPPVVEAIGNRKVLISGIAIGLVGYAIGTYLGTIFATILGLPLF